MLRQVHKTPETRDLLHKYYVFAPPVNKACQGTFFNATL